MHPIIWLLLTIVCFIGMVISSITFTSESSKPPKNKDGDMRISEVKPGEFIVERFMDHETWYQFSPSNSYRSVEECERMIEAVRNPSYRREPKVLKEFPKP